MSDDLLPANSTAMERAIAQVAKRLDNLPLPLRYLMNPQRCPAQALPWLAWALSVDDWDADWGEGVKRQVIAEAVKVHRHKGTLGAVKRSLRALLGSDRFTIIEGAQGGTYGGAITHNGDHFYGHDEHWAKYSVYVNQPISRAQADQIRRALADVAPARCELINLDFTAALNDHNTVIRYDGAYTYGIA